MSDFNWKRLALDLLITIPVAIGVLAAAIILGKGTFIAHDPMPFFLSIGSALVVRVMLVELRDEKTRTKALAGED